MCAEKVKKRILFAAGGTGGHIFPALAVDQALRSLDADIETRFVCGSRPVEKELFRKAGKQPFVLNVASPGSGVFRRALGTFQLTCGFFKALQLLRNWKPDRILGQGGYITAPVLTAARVLGIPYDLQEQNTVPGRTNRWFAQRAESVFCSFRQTLVYFKTDKKGSDYCYTGMPLREEVISRNGTEVAEARRRFHLDPSLPVLLVIGGSQGALALYRCLLKALYRLDNLLASAASALPEDKTNASGAGPELLQCLWSTGARNLDWIRSELHARPPDHIRVALLPFIDEMGLAYRAASMAVSRAGACSVAELMANGIPTVFVPLPHATGDHQTLNAREAVSAGAAMMISQGDLHEDKLAGIIFDWMNSRERREKMSRAARKSAPLDAAQMIATRLRKKVKNCC